MLGQLSGQQEPDSCLNLSGGDGGPLVVVSKFAGLCSNPLKEVVDKGVHDAHSLGRHTSVRMNLFQHLREEIRVQGREWSKGLRVARSQGLKVSGSQGLKV